MKGILAGFWCLGMEHPRKRLRSNPQEKISFDVVPSCFISVIVVKTRLIQRETKKEKLREVQKRFHLFCLKWTSYAGSELRVVSPSALRLLIGVGGLMTACDEKLLGQHLQKKETILQKKRMCKFCFAKILAGETMGEWLKRNLCALQCWVWAVVSLQME